MGEGLPWESENTTSFICTFLTFIHRIEKNLTSLFGGFAMSQPDLNQFAGDPKAAALLRNPAALKALLASPEARKLLTLLNEQNGANLHQAAQQAGAGNTAALSAMLKQLSQSAEGKAALDHLAGQIEK
jgi:hypothetical protein